jgi:hypothetical protein
MARGWQRKSVEDHSSPDFAVAVKVKVRPEPDTAELEIVRKREGLLLSRSRVLHDLAAAHNPRYKIILNQALAHLDRQLQELG